MFVSNLFYGAAAKGGGKELARARIKDFSAFRIFEYVAIILLLLLLLFWKSLISSWFPLLTDSIIQVVIGLVVLPYSIYLIIHFVRIVPKTRGQLGRIIAAASLLIAIIIIAYSVLYHRIYQVYGIGSFNSEPLSEGDFLYLSVMTFTATGFGDISSRGALAHCAVASEMLVGYFSGTILLAILVWKLIQSLRNYG